MGSRPGQALESSAPLAVGRRPREANSPGREARLEHPQVVAFNLARHNLTVTSQLFTTEHESYSTFDPW